MGKVYACSDLHGMYDLYRQVKKFLQPDDKVYFLGDAVDRGPQSWKTFHSIINDEQFIYIKGNHEDMLADAITDYIESDGRISNFCYGYFENGGVNTFESWLQNGAYEQWVEVLDCLSYLETYTNIKGQKIFLSHAGFTPRKKTFEISTNELLWDRKHCGDNWITKKDFDNIFVIHGHTPVDYLYQSHGYSQPREGEQRVFWYCSDTNNIKHKCDIDLGCWVSNKIALLDLDTFEEHYFII